MLRLGFLRTAFDWFVVAANDFVRVKLDYEMVVVGGLVAVVLVLLLVVQVCVIDSIVVWEWLVGIMIANQDPRWLFGL